MGQCDSTHTDSHIHTHMVGNDQIRIIGVPTPQDIISLF